MMTCIVYIAINRNNGKRYIGVTKCGLEKRRSQHISLAFKGTRTSVFGSAIRKYGADAFEFSVLSTLPNYEDALRAERDAIAQLKPEYNVAAGGRGPMNTKWSDARRRRTVFKLTASWTTERRVAASARIKGRVPLAALAASLEGRRAGLLGTKVTCLNDGRNYPSIKFAAKHYGVSRHGIGEVISGRQLKTGGLSFIYADQTLSPVECHRELQKMEARRLAGVENRRLSRMRAVECVTAGAIFDSATDVAKHYGMSKSRVSQLCLTGGVWRGLQFKYVDQDSVVARPEKSEEEKRISRHLVLEALARGQKKIKRPVVCLDDRRTFCSITEAAKAYGAHISAVSAAIYRNGRANGKAFRFADRAA